MAAVQGATPRGLQREATRAWFESAFAEPTQAQAEAWHAIGQGEEHTLVVAPTGSGKTLAAFLWAIDKLAREPQPADPKRRCRVLYICRSRPSPSTWSRNLRSPLTGVDTRRTVGYWPARARHQSRCSDGDTAADERRKLAYQAAGHSDHDARVTVPHADLAGQGDPAKRSDRHHRRGARASGQQARRSPGAFARAATDALRTVTTLARRSGLPERIGLSATVRPPRKLREFLGGALPVTIVSPPSDKRLDLRIVVPVEDMSDLQGGEEPDRTGSRAKSRRAWIGRIEDPVRLYSIWPHVEERVLDLIQSHRSTIVFANSRRLAERLCARLNDLAAERAAEATEAAELDEMAHSAGDSFAGPAAQLLGQSGTSLGAAPIVARAHHGSVSRQERSQIEEALKAGTLLRPVVATSSLELGIDMGAVDLVIQVESPPSCCERTAADWPGWGITSATSRAAFSSLSTRATLSSPPWSPSACEAGRSRNWVMPRNPLDVLAQHIVAMTAMDDWDVTDLEHTVRRAAPFSGLTRPVLDAVLGDARGPVSERGLRRAAPAAGSGIAPRGRADRPDPVQPKDWP